MLMRVIANAMRSTMPKSLYCAALRPYYSFAIYVVVQMLSRKYYVRNIYLTGSAAAGKLTYGVSDLDFIIEIAESAEVSMHRNEIFKLFRKIRRFFPQIQPEYEVAIHPSREIDQVLIFQRPYLFSISGMLQLLWSRDLSIRNLKYEIQHEIPLISRMWRKILLGWRCSRNTAEYQEHILSRVRSELLASAKRIGLEECVVLELGIKEVINLICQLLEAIGERAHLSFPIASSLPIMDRRIPNMLYFETAPLSVYFAGAPGLPPSLLIREISEKNYEAIEKLISSPDTHAVDFVNFNKVLLPVRYHQDVRILTQFTHPWTFSVLRRDFSFKDFKSYESLIESIGLAPLPELVIQQQYALTLLKEGEAQWSKILPTEVEFLKSIVSSWQKLLV